MGYELGDVIAVINLALLVVMIGGPPIVILSLYLSDRNQSQHAVLRNFPLLGRIRYVLEHIGPELRQYLFNSDREGKPFSRDDYHTVVFAGKYLKSIMSFGSKRDFDQPGWYLRNSMVVTLMQDLRIVREPLLPTRRYVIESEGLMSRKEKMGDQTVSPWTLPDEDALVVGAGLAHPWTLRGLIGMSAMSYGALGRNAIQAMSHGLAMATGSWLNTGEGGLSEHHLVGGGDVVFQIGPGLFGVRTEAGEWDWDEFRSKAAVPQVRGFELKIHQGAKIRGGHVEAEKVTEEIARIRRVPAFTTIDAPNRFEMFATIDQLFDHVSRMRSEAQKPVGIKVVVGGPGSCDDIAAAMARRGDGPDWITVDGGEGGSGAMYQEMADTMGLPVRSGLVEMDDALRRHGVRDRVRIFASGMMFSADRIAIALSLGADAVNIARGLMISVGCIQAQKCHSNQCPVGVATTDEKLMKALVVDEKKFRVMNYIVTLRAALASLTAAAGLRSPTEFTRHHAVYRDAYGRVASAADIFPSPRPGSARRPAVLPRIDVLRGDGALVGLGDEEKPEAR
ncbi:MAG: glutamate synthase-related protein [Myxococcota bacterium]